MGRQREKLIGLLAYVSFLSACATPQANYLPTAQQFSRPPLGNVVTVSVGDEMVSQGNLVTHEGIRLDAEAEIGLLVGYTLSAGFYPRSGQDDDAVYYGFALSSGSSDDGVLTRSALADPPQSVMVRNGQQEICVVTVFNAFSCDDDVSFEETARTIASENAFQQTLIYSGRVGDRINVSYREFFGSVARPAFNNDVEYDLTLSNEFAYRGARVRVISADNSGRHCHIK